PPSPFGPRAWPASPSPTGTVRSSGRRRSAVAPWRLGLALFYKVLDTAGRPGPGWGRDDRAARLPRSPPSRAPRARPGRPPLHPGDHGAGGRVHDVLGDGARADRPERPRRRDGRGSRTRRALARRLARRGGDRRRAGAGDGDPEGSSG